MDDFYIRTQNEKYSRDIRQLQNDLRAADSYFINCSSKLLAAEKEIEELKQTVKELEDFCEDKGQITSLYSILSNQSVLIDESLTKKHEWKEIAKKLYSSVLHLHSISCTSSVAVIGPSLKHEIVVSIDEYEKLLESELYK
jgi:archaellum component FlaC